MQKLVRVEVKNRFDRGDTIELVTPQGTTEMVVDTIYQTKLNHAIKKSGTNFADYVSHFDASKAQLIESAHGGGYEVWINMPENPGDFSLIRKRLKA